MATAQLRNFFAARDILTLDDQRFASVGIDGNVVACMANDDEFAKSMNPWPGIDHAAVSHGDN